MRTQSIPEQALRRKRGIGIMEIVVSALVLGILYMAVSNLQKGNREALMRIRGRDGATEVAQNILDSIGTLGLAKFMDASFADANGNPQTLHLDTIWRKWEGQPGLISHDIKIPYLADVTVSPDTTYQAMNSSWLRGADSLTHVFAKRVDVTVSWCFKCKGGAPNQHISISGVIR